MSGWMYLVHPETGGAQVAPDNPGVLEHFEARGWERHVMPAELDPNAPDTGAVYETERILSEDEALGLKGKALDEALDAAGLSKAGTADEKRARLAEHEAELAEDTTQEDEGNE